MNHYPERPRMTPHDTHDGDQDRTHAPSSNPHIYTNATTSLESITACIGHNTAADDAPIITYVSRLLFDAIEKNVSDIHIETYESSFRIRFRHDGVLRSIESPPAHLAKRIISRLKVMANLDIAERRIPQDGRISLAIDSAHALDCRVSTLPTMWGEKVVLRILNASQQRLPLTALGMTEQQYQAYHSALNKPQGLILVTGPTGSGKTTTMYSGLALLNTPNVNILTVEDPIEISLPGINQVAIERQQGLTFASAARAFLRQDPDIMMVGEIRDEETANIVIKAAQTGHLVLSTLHTNSVAQTIMRLQTMGVTGYNIASAMSVIIAQRLVRVLCDHCKYPVPNWREDHAYDALGESATPYQAQGCERCSHTGYTGRTGIFQVVPIDEAISQLMAHNASASELEQAFHQRGYVSIYEAGIIKVSSGITSMDEITRVTI